MSRVNPLVILLFGVFLGAAPYAIAQGDPRFDGARPRSGQPRSGSGASGASSGSSWSLGWIWDEARRLGARMGIPGVQAPPRRPVGGRLAVPSPPPTPAASPRMQRIMRSNITTIRVFDGWRARPQPRARAMTPVRITIHHTADEIRATDRNTSIEATRQILRGHLGRGYDDIGYNFIINSAGNLIEGRGDSVVGSHVENQNTGNVGISLMGNFENAQPAQAQGDTAVIVSAYLVNRHHIPTTRDGFLLGHRDNDGANTACPGRNVHAQLPQWRRDVRSAAQYYRAQSARGRFVAMAVYR